MIEWNDTTRQWVRDEVIQRLELEFHFWIDTARVDEDSLHAVWAFMILRRWYPGVRSETINQLIQSHGWH